MILVSLVAFAVTLALTPATIALCNKWKLYDPPGPLKIHSQPVPRLGGIALIGGILAGIIAGNIEGHHQLNSTTWHAAAALALVGFIGLIDDLRPISAVVRLTAQMFAGAILWQGGWRAPFVHAGLLSLIAVCGIIIFSVNSYNFVDGSDGLATTIVLAMAVSYVLLPRAALPPGAFVLATALAASCVAFLFYNAHPATIFLGDAGSTTVGLLGALLALTLVHTSGNSAATLLFPVAAASLPLIDAARVVAQRAASGKSVLSGSRNHFYDLQRNNGWSAQQIAVTSAGMTAASGIFAAGILRHRLSAEWILIPIIAAAIWIAVSTQAKPQQALKASNSRKVAA